MNHTDPNEAEQPNRPGKLRTWWHPLLVRLLDMELHGAYEVRDEVNVGKMPLRVDIVLIRRQDGQLPESASRDLFALVKLLNRFTLVEFKSPTDSLEAGDLDYLFACAHLFRAQQSQRIDHSELTLIVLAPSVTRPFLEDLSGTGLTAHEIEPGIHRIDRPLFATWLIECDRIAGPDEPVLTLFSRVFLQERSRIMGQLDQAGHRDVLHYAMQQIEQFKNIGEEFRMQHKDAGIMDATLDDWAANYLQANYLHRMPAEQRLQGLTVEDILKVLSKKELSPEERARLRELLERGEQAP